MNSSPMMIRIAELRIRSEPMIGPTVVTLLGPPPCGAPKRAMRAFSRSSNGVPGTTAGDTLGAVTAGVAEALDVGDAFGVGLAEADEDAVALAVAGASDALGAGVAGGSRSTGEVRIRRNPSPRRVTCASGWPSVTSACWTAWG